MNKKHIIIWVIIVVVVAVGSFYLGVKHAQGNTASTASSGASGFSRTGRTGSFGSGGASTTGGATGTGGIGGFAGGATIGQIVSAGDGTFTIQLPGTAGSKIIFYSDSTGITKTVSGSSADLTPGTSVIIGGTSNSNGSLTATRS